MNRRQPPTGALRGDHVATLMARRTVTDAGCWEYDGPHTLNGYVQVGRNLLGHRVIWEHINGPIADGLHIDHLCRNRGCFNPQHLEPVTPRENLMRGASLSAQNAAKTHCVNGHEFTEANTYYRPDRFGRICRTCRDAALAAARQTPEFRAKHAARERARRAAKRDDLAAFMAGDRKAPATRMRRRAS